jgi:hypothetical protein
VLKKITPFSRACVAVVFAFLVPSWLPAQSVLPGKPKTQPVQRVVEAAPAQRYSLKPAPVATMGPLNDNLRDQARRPGMLQVGVHRPVTAAMMALGVWEKNADGTTVWRLTLQSDNAVGLRIHFTNFSVGDGKVWIHDTANPPKQVFGPYSGLGVHGNGDLWTEVVFSDSVEVEYQPGFQAQSTGAPPFQIAEIAHLYRFAGRVAPLTGAVAGSATSSFYILPAEPSASAAATGMNTSCFIDATCEEGSATYPAVSLVTSSTAYLLFTQPGGEFQCSGNMLNAPNGQPVLLTAGHCIDSNAVALSLTAAFDYQTSTCNGAMPDPTLSPQVLGVQLLSYVDNPFLAQDNATQILDDLDYSLVQMAGYPSTPNFTLAGYSTDEVLFGQNVSSIGYPLGFSAQFAYAPRVDSRLDVYGATPYANAYQIEYTNTGRIDDGSSGSGIFDDEGRLLGSLSTAVVPCDNPDAAGNCPANSTSCDVTGPFDSWYSKFSATYQQIRDYLELPLPAILATNPSTFSATPNPIYNANASGLGTTTLFFNAPAGTKSIEIRVGSPSGSLLAETTASTGHVATGNWVSNGMEFYLQDTSNGKALTSANTLGVVTAQVVSSPTLTASPSTIVPPNGSWLGATTLSWTAPGHSNVQVVVGGTVFAGGGVTGTAATGYWVSDGMTFYLIDSGTQAVLASAVVHVNQDGGSTVTPGNAGSAALYLNPNPIQIPYGQVVGTTSVNWNAGSVPNIQIRVGSPTGALMANGYSSGSAPTGNWVSDGMTFYLVNAATQAVLATTSAQVTYNTIGLGNSLIQILNNPISVPADQSSGTANIQWSTSVSSQVEVHANAPNGPLVAAGGSVGSATFVGATEGTIFYLQDVTLTYTSGGQPVSYPLTLQYTLATVTAHVTNH